MDPRYGKRYRDLYERHWWWRARTEFIVEAIRRLSPAHGDILDIGCGDGLFFDRLSEFGEVQGIEPCAELVNPTNPHRQRIYISAFDEAFQPGKQYSLILMLDVLEHLDNPAAALRQIAALLRPGGWFVATVPAFNALWTNHDVLNHHRTRYTKSSLRNLIRDTGLSIREARYLYHWTFPLKLAVRASERLFPRKPEPPGIPARVLNEFFYHLSRVEQKTVSLLPMPFGSSLFVVASADPVFKEHA